MRGVITKLCVVIRFKMITQSKKHSSFNVQRSTFTEVVGKDAGSTLDLGGTGPRLIVFGSSRRSLVAGLGFLVTLQAQDFGTYQAAVLGFRTR